MTSKVESKTQEAEGGPAWSRDREEFLNTMVGALCDTIEDVVGVGDAGAFIGIVGRRMAKCACAASPEPVGTAPADVAERLVDLKNRIGGKFEVDKVDGATVTLTNSQCPFGAEAKGRASVCKMTTNFLGRVAADATGYASVEVEEALSRGDDRCVIKIDLERNGDSNGEEFYG